MNGGTVGNKINTSIAIFFTLALTVTGVLAGCGSSSSSGLSDQGSVGSVDGSRFTFVWPAGYSYDSTSNTLTGPSTKLQSSAPAYVTGATVTFSQPGMTPITIDVSLSTGVVVFVIPPGTYTIDVVVTTSIGLTFTSTQTADLLPGFNDLAFSLSVNAPPTITSVTASSTSPTVGETITLTCSATDLDTDDTLTYSWSGAATGSGASITYHVTGAGSATFTCQVTDGHGGTDTGSATINGKVASYTTAMSGSVTEDRICPVFDEWKLNVQPGDAITVTCAIAGTAKLFTSAFDPNVTSPNPLMTGLSMTWTAGQANYWLDIEVPLNGGKPVAVPYTCTMTTGSPATATQTVDDFVNLC